MASQVAESGEPTETASKGSEARTMIYNSGSPLT